MSNATNTPIVVELGQALATEINTRFGEQFEAQLSFGDWDLPLHANDGETLRCDVVPFSTGYRVEMDTVQKWRHYVPFDIALRKRLTDADQEGSGEQRRIKTESLTPLIMHWQRLFEFLLPSQPYQSGFQLGDAYDAFFASLEHPIPYLKKHLKHLQYTGLFRIALTVDREPSQ